METSVRQLIANGKFRTALENAKEFHKKQNTPISEALLMDAYAARIQSLADQNLATEAQSLADLVRERFPWAKERLDLLKAATSARSGNLDQVLGPLNDPELSADRRAAIERIISTQVTDLAGLANSAALPPEHNLRKAAAALDRAFAAVTSGPVTEEQIALAEVSHRSPLAGWKLLIRAIACFHRVEDEACREFLAAIKPEAAAARLIPAMRAMLDDKPGASLSPPEAALVSQIRPNLRDLRSALTNLDRAFEDQGNQGALFKAVRAAVRECQRSAPDRLMKLKQLIAVRGGVNDLDQSRLNAALEGAARQDAAYFRMFACALEDAGGAEELALACGMWDGFRHEALHDAWFPAGGVEEATLILHMAELAGRVPEDLRIELRRAYESRPGKGGVRGDGSEMYYLQPEKLYALASELDPRGEAFPRWMRWASGRRASEAEGVAREWHKRCPDEIDPVLYLMRQSEKRSAFPTALGYLEKAERIDAVHPVVRAARMRLLAAAAMRHLQQKKPKLAEAKLAEMTALPQSQQGDRPAFLAALRHVIRLVSGKTAEAMETRAEVERLLPGGTAAAMLIFGVAGIAKQLHAFPLPGIKSLSQRERAEIPVNLARVMAIAKDFGIAKFALPAAFFDEAETQFPGVRTSLNVEQLGLMGELGMATGHSRLAWAASGEGLSRGGPSEAGFLLLRSRALGPQQNERSLAIAAAAAALGRFHRDAGVVDKAVEILRNPYGGDSISFTLEQAREVVRRELDSPAFPSLFRPGPDYRDLMPENTCQCEDCKRRRGEEVGLFDDDDEDDFEDGGFEEGGEFSEAEMERVFNERAPKGMAPDVKKILFQIMRESFLAGESPEKGMDRFLGGGKRKKGRRK
jgi:hypothetical protein